MGNKFIVIEGIDGSGKETQANLLIEYLNKKDKKVELISFPQHGKKSAGMVEKYLKEGKYGKAEEVDPKIASIFYACDRYDGSFKIKKWLKEGKFVIADRYVSSNAGHQGGKIKNKEERTKFIKWLYKLEYDLFNIPKPDKVIFLKIPPEFSIKITKEKNSNDIHETDLDHLRGAYESYLQLADREDNFEIIEVIKDNKFLPREKIARKIREIVL